MEMKATFKNDIRNIQEGDLIKWFELYQEGIVKDVGLGSVLQKREINMGGNLPYVQYEIWRFQKNDIIMCSPAEIELVE